MANDLYGIPSMDSRPAGFSGFGSSKPEPHDAINGLLHELPNVGTCWPSSARRRWLDALSRILAVLYVEKPEDVKAVPESAWWMVPKPEPLVAVSHEQLKKLVDAEIDGAKMRRRLTNGDNGNGHSATLQSATAGKAQAHKRQPRRAPTTKGKH